MKLVYNSDSFVGIFAEWQRELIDGLNINQHVIHTILILSFKE